MRYPLNHSTIGSGAILGTIGYYQTRTRENAGNGVMGKWLIQRVIF